MPQKLTPEVVIAAIAGFEAQKNHIDSQIAELRSMLDSRGPTSTVTSPETGKPRRKFSVVARRKMAAAQRARYARLKQGSEPPQPAIAKPKRKVSRAARAKMAEAQKARWAKIKGSEQPAAAKKAVRKKPIAKSVTE